MSTAFAMAIAAMVTFSYTPFANEVDWGIQQREVTVHEAFNGGTLIQFLPHRYSGQPDIWEELGLCPPRWCEYSGSGSGSHWDRKCQERLANNRPCYDWNDLNTFDPPLYMLIGRVPL